MTAPIPFQPRPDDDIRRAALASMKRRATGLLAVAAAVFVAAWYFESAYPWLGYVRATAEASLVGGLADWFAVTAIFRHPLGIPIPHTAIVGRQKDRIGRIIGNFIQQHFLSREAVAAKLGQMEIASRIARWLAEPANAHRVASQVAAGVAKTLEALPDEKIRATLHEAARERVRATRVAPIVGKTLAAALESDRHQEIFNEAIKLAAQSVTENQDKIRARVKAESPWWVPSVIDEKLYRKIVAAIERSLHDIRDDPAHPVREGFDRALKDFTDRLQHSPETGARAEALKEEWLSDETLGELTDKIWETTRRAVSGYALKEEGPEPGPLARGVVAFGREVTENPKLLREIEDFITGIVLQVVEDHRHEMADLIAQTVARWDPGATADRLELAVGRDLQFVRINGTLVGGLVGLLLYAVPRLLGGGE
ncbi:MAG TPA: DUF445 domain-containing protein [Gemmatimonadales bacterium]|nr:DUF445 domain-containing protein [Gemmatimonadales bacterium]